MQAQFRQHLTRFEGEISNQKIALSLPWINSCCGL